MTLRFVLSLLPHHLEHPVRTGQPLQLYLSLLACPLDARLHGGDIVRLWTIPVSVSLDGSGHQQAPAAVGWRLCAWAGRLSTGGGQQAPRIEQGGQPATSLSARLSVCAREELGMAEARYIRNYFSLAHRGQSTVTSGFKCA